MNAALVIFVTLTFTLLAIGYFAWMDSRKQEQRRQRMEERRNRNLGGVQ